ncbi:UNVERIFIED_CONTAM: hypothetical protein HDU68_008561 [Siphonaria sp. JEL0065]|nr:hypothetical protein HDU68_008561 [Siphonaria sp. JEL0065]
MSEAAGSSLDLAGEESVSDDTASQQITAESAVDPDIEPQESVQAIQQLAEQQQNTLATDSTQGSSQEAVEAIIPPQTPPTPYISPPRTPLDKFDYTYRAGKGGKGWWKYLTKPRGSDQQKQQAQFLTLWFTPTPKAPIPRATAGVWFVYEKLDDERSKAFTKILHAKLQEKGKSSTGIIQTGVISYRFEHSHLTHTIPIPSKLEYLPNFLADENPSSTEAHLGAPYLRIPELVSSNLIVSQMVESGKLLKEAQKRNPSNMENTDDPPVTGAGIQLKVNGNGVPLEVIQELARTENYPILSAKQVIMRHHLVPDMKAKIPLADVELYADIATQQQEAEDERLKVVESRVQQRISKRMLA